MSDIVNPYIAGNPVTGSEMFFGRGDIFQFIRQALVGQHRDNVIVLYGQRRTGKTSVLYQMHSHLDAHYLCIFVDLHGFALEGISGFLWELANNMVRSLHREYQIDLPRPNRLEFMADPRNFFENEFLSQVWSVCGDQHVLLMLDEAIRLQEQVQADKLEHEIFEYLRHLMQHYERLNFLFSLGSGLEEMEKEYSFLFSVGLYKKISFLDHDAANALITQPIKDFYQVEPNAVERILQITSGHPYYTQLLCHSLFYRWQQRHIPRIEVLDVDEVLDEVVERGLAVLKHVWEESTSGEKAIMTGMATSMGEYNSLIETNDINRAWAQCDVVIPKGEMANAIRNLIARDVITGQNKYMFTVELQRLWVQKYRRLEWVKEEIEDTIREWSSNIEIVKSLPNTRISRRSVILGLTGLAIVSATAVGIILREYTQRSISHTIPGPIFTHTSRAATPTFTPTQQGSGIPKGKLLYSASSPGPTCDTGGGRWVNINQSTISCLPIGDVKISNTNQSSKLVGTMLISLPGISFPSNYVIQAQLQQASTSSSDFGIYFRNQPGDLQGTYTFLIHPDGTWSAYVYDNKTAIPTEITNGRSIGDAHASILVDVAIMNRNFSFYVNGRQVGSVTDGKYSTGTVGIAVDQGGTVFARNFALYMIA